MILAQMPNTDNPNHDLFSHRILFFLWIASTVLMSSKVNRKQ